MTISGSTSGNNQSRRHSIDEENLKLPFLFDLSDEAILALIENGSAKYGFEISCSSTSIRYVEFVEEAGPTNSTRNNSLEKLTLVLVFS